MREPKSARAGGGTGGPATGSPRATGRERVERREVAVAQGELLHERGDGGANVGAIGRARVELLGEALDRVDVAHGAGERADEPLPLLERERAGEHGGDVGAASAEGLVVGVLAEREGAEFVDAPLLVGLLDDGEPDVLRGALEGDARGVEADVGGDASRRALVAVESGEGFAQRREGGQISHAAHGSTPPKRFVYDRAPMEEGDVLEARFKPEGDEWKLTLLANNQPLACKNRKFLPDDPDALLGWIVSVDEHPELREKTWRLRVRPESLDGNVDPLPPVLSWPRLLDGGQSVFLRDWTLCVLHAPRKPDAWQCSGKVVVVGDRSVANDLAKQLGDEVVSHAQPDAITEGAIVVVPAALTSDEVNALRAAAKANQCPLVIWCGTVLPAPSSSLLEVVPTGEPLPENDGLATWLTRLLTGLLAGVDPERALARSMRDGPPGPLDSWLLRGCLRPWKVKDDHRAWQLRFRHWRFEIDRTVQNALRREAVDGLLDSTQRRVQVVMLAGPVEAGLRFFRERPLRVERPGLRVEACEPAWSEPAARSFDGLYHWFKVKPSPGHSPLRNALLSRLAGARTLLLHVNHNDAPHDALTDADLDAYLAALSEFGASLPETIRVLASVYVVTPTPDRLERFEQFEAPPSLGITVLPQLGPTIPEQEIVQFLKNRDIEPDAAKRAKLASELAAMPYEEIVKTLSTLYHPKLRAP